MKNKIIKKEKESQKKANASFSRRIGLLAGIAVLFTLVLDAISLFCEITNLSIIMGIVMLLIIIIVMSNRFAQYLDKKINRKDYFAKVIDAATISSVFAFSIERFVMPLIKYSKSGLVMVLFLIGIFIALPIIICVLLFGKKDANYHVEG